MPGSHGRKVFPVKICGLTRWEDVALASQLGAWALGFVLYPKSPRYIPLSELKILLERLKNEFEHPPKTVAVVVNETLADLKNLVQSSGIDALQLHGDETVASVVQIVEQCQVEIIKAFRPKSLHDLADVDELTMVDYFLIDANVKGLYGGSGQLADWSLARDLQKRHPVLVSGGLLPENVLQAIRTVKPAALDLSSGVEGRPGIKSAAKLQELFRQLEESV